MTPDHNPIQHVVDPRAPALHVTVHGNRITIVFADKWSYTTTLTGTREQVAKRLVDLSFAVGRAA